jgi:tRNA threonylcarbamoyladenosine biosynthesis protein TsaB
VRLLAIETSTSSYTVTLAVDGIVHEMGRTTRLDADFDGIAGLVRTQLARQGCTGRDITDIAVNRGPGNLTSVRAGLSYANGLAFAVGASAHSANTLAILAFMARERVPLDIPVLVLHPARGRHGSLFYTGVVAPDGSSSFGLAHSGGFDGILGPGVTEAILAGSGAEHLGAAPGNVKFHESKVTHADSRALVEMFTRGLLRETRSPVTPLTDESETFHGSA